MSSGDNAGAIPFSKAVLEQKCLFPRKAKDAAKALKKLAVAEAASLADAPHFSPPIFDRVIGAKIERIMKQGLRAENSAHYGEAEGLYALAHRMNPADPTPLRYLGEVYGHLIGDWAGARAFHAIQAMPDDRAIALHGNGKMTIHEGEFKKGLASASRNSRSQLFPRLSRYRDLAVYWNSEGDRVKTKDYVAQNARVGTSRCLQPVFAARFMATNGRGEEALKIAHEKEGMLLASYNLAAIDAQLGQREPFYQATFLPIRALRILPAPKMMEDPLVDVLVATLMRDPEFLELTKGADGRLPIPQPKTMNRSDGGM